jgi:hypothetical protein
MIKIPAPSRKLLLYYSAFAALFITISGFLSVKKVENASFQLIFLPVTMYLFLEVSRDLKKNLYKGKVTIKEKDPKTKKRTSFYIFFIIYMILVGIGVNNIISARGESVDIQKTVDESTPLIFKVNESNKPTRTITAYVKDDILVEIKKDPLFDSETLDVLEEDKMYVIQEEFGDWYKVRLSETTSGYLHKTFTIKEGE